MKPKIAVLSTSRSDRSILHWTLHEIARDPSFELSIIEHAFQPTGDSPQDANLAAITLGRTVASQLAEISPHLLIVVGDRYEILPCAQAALILGIPIAHFHGGETTEGAIDDAIRNAVSMLAAFHFASNESHRQKLISMGVSQDKVWNFGAPGAENIIRQPSPTPEEWISQFGFPLPEKYLLLSYHPVTRFPDESISGLESLLACLDTQKEMSFIFTRPNADPQSTLLWDRIKSWNKAHCIESLGSRFYPHALRNATAIAGNSSSGIIESGVAAIPALNIGRRQLRRIAGENVVHCDATESSIRAGLEKVTSGAFKHSTQTAASPYGTAHFSMRFVNWLREFTR